MKKLTITESVLTSIADRLSKNASGSGDEHCFRLVKSSTGEPELTLDTFRPDDVHFPAHGKTVLVISGTLAEELANRTLDINRAGDFVLL